MGMLLPLMLRRVLMSDRLTHESVPGTNSP